MRIQRKSVSEISKPPFSKSTLSLLTRSVPLESCVSLLSRYTTRFVFPTRFRLEIQRNLQRHSLKNAKLTVGSVFWLSTADVITIPNHHIAILSRENCQSSKTTWKAHALQFWSDSDQKYDFHKIVRNLLQSGIRYQGSVCLHIWSAPGLGILWSTTLKKFYQTRFLVLNGLHFGKN